MNIDIHGTLLITEVMLPLMMIRGDSIVNTSSFSRQAVGLYRSGYDAAKGAMINFTKSVAIKYGRDGIRANVIVPGTIKTLLVDKLTDTNEDKEDKTFRENQRWMTPLGYSDKPEEAGRFVVFLASDESPFTTGETIRIDGGVMTYIWSGEVLSDDSWKWALE